MDPLNALSIAASVIQFVQFSSNILNGAVKIYQSSEGVSYQTQHLSGVYTKLSQLGSSLQTQVCADASIFSEPAVTQRCASAIVQLGKDCKADCDKLLSIVYQLQIGKTDGRWWKSFRIALKEHLKSDEISRLQKRIENYETTIMMHLCTLSSQHCMTLQKEIRELDSGWKNRIRNYQAELERLNTSLTKIESRVKEMLRQNRYLIDAMDVELLTSKLAASSIETGRLKKIHDILWSLDYAQRQDRHEAITLAHQETFQWALHRRQGSGNDNHGYAHGKGDFSRWLSEENDTFWISGKPGSGKSTLLKFLAGHRDTRRLLDSSLWAASSKVVVASHYFWSAGTAIQRSQQGLWRSLLYEILRRDTPMIPRVCIERWGCADEDLHRKPWSLPELLNCIQNVAEQRLPGIKFCIFVDGLDEFEGDPLDLITPLQALSKSSFVKLCVASRPWNAFEQAFGHRSDLKLYVHDLTVGDIRAFASDRLNSHPNWATIASKENSMSIVEDITERSGGVFLWVFLVTRELREGLTNSDTLSDLKKRLDTMPSDLGLFFKHILDSVHSFYHGRTAEALRLALAADDVNDGLSLHFSVYYFHEKEDDDPGLALRMPVEPKLEVHTEKHMKKRVHCRLDAICKGLLELNGNSVGYIHRTVRDWLKTPEMQQYLDEKSSPTFNPYRAILSSCLAAIKTTNFKDTILIKNRNMVFNFDGLLNSRLREALSYVSKADSTAKRIGGVQAFEMIECLGETVEQLFVVRAAHFSPWGVGPDKLSKIMFRQHLLQAQLWHYISSKLHVDPEFFAQYPVTPFYALMGNGFGDNLLTLQSRVLWTQKRVESIYRVLTNFETEISGCSDECACTARVIWTFLVRDCLPKNILDEKAKPTAENLVSFKSALDFGIISRLASQFRASAEICVARTRLTSLVPAWFTLILLLLKSAELSRQHKEEFLRILEGILSWPTADFSCLVNSTDSRGTTLGDVLCRHLQYHKQSMVRQSGAQDDFMAGIGCLVLAKMETQSAGSDQMIRIRRMLKSTISNCFPESSTKYLVAIFGPDQESATMNNVAMKKKREKHDEVTGGPLHKRGKLTDES